MSLIEQFRRDSRGKSFVSKGFTIVELLTVMAIIALLSLSVPTLQSMMTAGTFNSNTSQMNDLLRAAYSAAIARNTYVWVGIVQMPNNSGVGMAIVYSPSGNPADILASNPAYLFKPVVLKNLNLAIISSGTTGQISNPNRVTSGVAQVFSSSNQLSVTDPTTGRSHTPILNAAFGGVSQTIEPNYNLGTSALIEITPTGQMTIASGRSAWLEIGLQPAQGNSSEAAVLQMNSFTGRIVQFLP
jgi:prepilin-type N-terminal cleavage/methylation domain-containing protein